METPEEAGLGVVKRALGRLRPEPPMREALSGAVHAIHGVGLPRGEGLGILADGELLLLILPFRRRCFKLY